LQAINEYGINYNLNSAKKGGKEEHLQEIAIA
jgi:hypothetical protein